ncbi:MAG TPA: NAD(P)H-hydrate dehydratase [Agriterribacter sp.]|nr:NAD(P)H-hydrate dehydratase [Agriterribacter sp.]
MKLFSVAQIKEWDNYTIQHEPVISIDLMERAAIGCCEWITANVSISKKYLVFCGPGNNGGDGLAIARLLFNSNCKIEVFLLGEPEQRSVDFQMNLARLEACAIPVKLINNEGDFPVLTDSDCIIDALFGYGLNRPLEGLAMALVKHINRSNSQVLAIDMPSGLFADKSAKGNTIINASVTLSFQVMKLAFLLPENANYTGDIQIIKIGLHPQYYSDTRADFETVEGEYIHSLIQPRHRFSHKGTYGNAALIAGSYGMMGAAVLAAKACLRSGVGKLTCYVPGCGYTILQTAVPEAMCVTDMNEKMHTSLDLKSDYDVYAIGPGLGQNKTVVNVLETLLNKKPERLIIDADGLNLLSQNPQLYPKISKHAILTPHPKEFERLFGEAANDFERLQLALEKAATLQVYIVLKGSYSFIAMPSGKGYFNPTGNPGMATAGSGDVLTGMLAGLYAQSNNTEKIVLTGVYLHGLAGDIAAKKRTEEAMIAGDIVDCIPAAFTHIKSNVYFA